MLNRENTINSLKDDKVVESHGIKIKELPYVKKINLRIDPNNKVSLSSVTKILGTLLPIKSNTYNKFGKVKTIWLGPNEWLVVNEEENDIFTKLKNEIGDKNGSVTDVSENRTIIRISGEKIYTLLSKFLTLNLEQNLSHHSSCVQTLFVKVPILIINNNDNTNEFDIFINRSHANYVFKLLLDGTKILHF